MERGLGDDPERVGLHLACRGCVFPRRRHRGPALGVEPVARRHDGLADDCTDLRREPAADDEHAVFVLVDGERPAALPPLGLAVLGIAVHPAPGPHQALDVGGGTASGEGEQPLFGLGRGHARERPYLGVGELAAGQRRGDAGHAGQSSGDPDAFVGGMELEAEGVKLADEVQQASGGDFDMRRELGDLIAQALRGFDVGMHASLLCGDSKPGNRRHHRGPLRGDREGKCVA